MKKRTEHRMERIIPADIEWDDNTPVSRHYDDIYFSKDDGIAETEYVFLKQNNLPDAWENKKQFSILETGFGTGLNFFCTLDLWLKTAEDEACLQYISVEKFPLSKEDFSQQAKVWPQFSEIIDQVLSGYPPLISGFHSCSLYDGRVKLLLLFGDATGQLSDLTASVDTCFLDGFAPSKNQSMWTNELFSELSRLLKIGGTLSTFTAVGDVRRGLQDVGFAMKKADAYGKKRHMLIGVLQQSTKPCLLKPWYQYPVDKAGDKGATKEATVIGAGIAGLTTAIALHESGWKVTVIEQADTVGSCASGNKAGVVMPRMDKQQNTDARFYWQSFFLALRKIKQFEKNGLKSGWKQTGVMQLAKDAASYLKDWPDDLFTEIKQNDTKDIAGVEVSSDALWIAEAGYIRPELFCHNLFKHYENKIKFIFNASATKLIQHSSDKWTVEGTQNSYDADMVVVCNAQAANQFEQTQYLALQPVRGQLSYLKSDLSKKVKTIICDKGHVLPVDDSELLIGATFNRDDTDINMRSEDHAFNLEQFNNSLHENERLNTQENMPKEGRTSIRAVTVDRMPIAGMVPDFTSYQQQYADLSKGKRVSSYQAGKYHNGLFINAGHGSRGFTSSFLSAEVITALASNQALPLDPTAVERLHPARFVIKQWQKGKKSSK